MFRLRILKVVSTKILLSFVSGSSLTTYIFAEQLFQLPCSGHSGVLFLKKVAVFRETVTLAANRSIQIQADYRSVHFNELCSASKFSLS